VSQLSLSWRSICLYSIALLALPLIASNSLAQTTKSDSPAPQLPSLPDVEPPKTAAGAAVAHAKAMFDAGKKQEALEELTRIIDSDSGTIDAHYAALDLRARCWADLGKKEQALRDLATVIDSKRADDVLKELALGTRMRIHSVAADWPPVVEDATRFLVFTPTSDTKELRVGVLSMRALAYGQLGEHAKALADCNAALTEPGIAAGEQMEIYFQRAVVYLDLNERKAAIDDFNRVIDSPKTADNVRAKAREALKQIGANEAHAAKQPDDQMAAPVGMDAVGHAKTLSEAGKQQQALEELTKIIDADRSTVPAHYMSLLLRAQILAAMKKPDGALLDLQAITNSQDAPDYMKNAAWLARLSIHTNAEQWKSAAQDATQILSRGDGRDFKTSTGATRCIILFGRAMAYYRLGEQSKALIDCNEALNDSDLTGNLRVNVYLLRSHVNLKLNNASAAADDFQRVIDSPDTTEKMRANTRQELKELRDKSATQPATAPSQR